MYQAAQDIRKTGRLSRRSFLGAAAETLGLVGVVGGTGLLPKTARAMERNPNGYPVPDLSGLRPYQTLHHDVNAKIPGKETFVERFKLANGGKAARGSINGRIYVYSVKETPNSSWYAVLDSNGDGRFDAKFSQGEEFNVPDWLINQALAKK